MPVSVVLVRLQAQIDKRHRDGRAADDACNGRNIGKTHCTPFKRISYCELIAERPDLVSRWGHEWRWTPDKRATWVPWPPPRRRRLALTAVRA